jgi:tetratricopeptide (TPR) repeat protein
VLLLVYAACFMTSLVFTRLAETAYKQQRYDHSMQWGRRAVTLLPWNTQAQHFVVMSLYRQQSPRDQLVMGIERLSRWYRSFPGQLQERAQLYFLLYQRFGQPADQAAMNDTLTTLATIEPYAGFTYSFAANLYYQTGQLDQALAAITQYLSTPQRRNQYSWLLLAQIQLARGQQALAEKALRQAYAAESYPTPFRNQIGTLVRSGLEGVTSLPFMFATE